MQIGVITINHETATVAQREKCHMTEGKQMHFLNQMVDQGLQEVSLLETCGRFEVYYVSTKESFDRATQTLLSALSSLAAQNLWTCASGDKAIEHLFKVAIGMESAVLGEDQILGQVKNALVFSNECGTSGKILNKVFRDAITFAKKIKTELKISEVPLSLSYIAIKKAKAHMPFNAHTDITMVGLGKMGKLAIQYLLDEPFNSLTICVRNPETLPSDLLTHPRIHIASFDDRYIHIAKSHLVVTSTAAPHSIIRKPFFEKKVTNQLIIDLAVPRDVCDGLYEDINLTIWDVDSLKEASSENLSKRKALMEKVEDWLKADSILSLNWLEATKVDDVLRGWQNDIESITQEALSRVKLGDDNHALISDEKLEQIIKSALKKMIKKPIENLKSIDNSVKREQSVQILKELFEYDF